jgi:hypothetical protein
MWERSGANSVASHRTARADITSTLEPARANRVQIVRCVRDPLDCRRVVVRGPPAWEDKFPE